MTDETYCIHCNKKNHVVTLVEQKTHLCCPECFGNCPLRIDKKEVVKC